MTGFAIRVIARPLVKPWKTGEGSVNRRLISVGAVLIVLAGAFFVGMTTIAPKSNDPVEMMRTVGMISGGAASLGAAMMIFGLFGGRRG